MLNRREFLRNSGAMALGAMVLSGSAKAFLLKDKLPPAGVQLFTFFPKMDNDVKGTLKQIADIGYKEVESAFSMKGGYYGMKPAEFAQMVKDVGLSWKSHHVLGTPYINPSTGKPMTDQSGTPLRTLRDNYQELIDEVAGAHVPCIVCATTAFGNAEELKTSIDILNKSAEAAKKAGITLAYHNHDKEFTSVDGKVVYDRFLDEITPVMKMELDLCWVTKAGVDPVALFKKHPGRYPLWHVKDIDKDFTGPQPVGTGVVDFKRIFENAKIAGLQHYFVEHDMPADAVQSITTSFNNLKKIIG
ncbi:MAG TPA: sugar phosphate isomerase/epimerase [Ohtaekwangia sp.]|uniref:sugar phosphate isomerase/epimerase family protein n=1 Tax=Ohtaekwangia sp. TaxID=2066019 RepID=UPI002F934DED